MCVICSILISFSKSLGKPPWQQNQCRDSPKHFGEPYHLLNCKISLYPIGTMGHGLVLYIYLHDWLIFYRKLCKFVGKYTSPMDPWVFQHGSYIKDHKCAGMVHLLDGFPYCYPLSGITNHRSESVSPCLFPAKLRVDIKKQKPISPWSAKSRPNKDECRSFWHDFRVFCWEALLVVSWVI